MEEVGGEFGEVWKNMVPEYHGTRTQGPKHLPHWHQVYMYRHKFDSLLFVLVIDVLIRRVFVIHRAKNFTSHMACR